MNLPVRINLTVAQSSGGQYVVKVTDEDGGEWGTATASSLTMALHRAEPIEAAAVRDVQGAAA